MRRGLIPAPAGTGPRRWASFALLAALFAALPAAAREEVAYVRAAYGNGRDQISVRRAGDAPAVFLPCGISTFARHGGITYVPDAYKFAFRLYDSNGLFLREAPLDDKARAGGPILFGDLTVDSEEILLTDTLHGAILRLDSGFRTLAVIDTAAIDERFRTPGLIFRDAAGQVYISDVNSGRLYVFANRKFTAPVVLENVENPCVLPEGIVVTTRLEAENRVTVISLLDREGRYLGSLGRIESAEPMGPVTCIGRDKTGMFHFSHRIRGRQIFTLLSETGRVVERCEFPEGLATLLLLRHALVDPDGTMFLMHPEKAQLVIRMYKRE